MLQLDEFRRGTILAENDEFLTVKWPPLPGWPAPSGGSACYPALTVVYRKDSVRQRKRRQQRRAIHSSNPGNRMGELPGPAASCAGGILKAGLIVMPGKITRLDLIDEEQREPNKTSGIYKTT